MKDEFKYVVKNYVKKNLGNSKNLQLIFIPLNSIIIDLKENPDLETCRQLMWIYDDVLNAGDSSKANKKI